MVSPRVYPVPLKHHGTALNFRATIDKPVPSSLVHYKHQVYRTLECHILSPPRLAACYLIRLEQENGTNSLLHCNCWLQDLWGHECICDYTTRTFLSESSQNLLMSSSRNNLSFKKQGSVWHFINPSSEGKVKAESLEWPLAVCPAFDKIWKAEAVDHGTMPPGFPGEDSEPP